MSRSMSAILVLLVKTSVTGTRENGRTGDGVEVVVHDGVEERAPRRPVFLRIRHDDIDAACSTGYLTSQIQETKNRIMSPGQT
jgi:hypothetical protein